LGVRDLCPDDAKKDCKRKERRDEIRRAQRAKAQNMPDRDQCSSTRTVGDEMKLRPQIDRQGDCKQDRSDDEHTTQISGQHVSGVVAGGR
jgi:hypothetical protein